MNIKYGVALLAGGHSRRMGNIDKAQLFREHMLREVEATGLSCFYSYAHYPTEPIDGWIMVKDAGEMGPMGAVYECLKEAKNQNLRGLYFVPCDAPRFDADEVRVLAKYIDDSTLAAVWADEFGRLEATFAYCSVDLIPGIAELIETGDYRLRRIFDIAEALDPSRVVRADIRDDEVNQQWFTNINTPDEYRILTDGPFGTNYGEARREK